MSLLMILNTSFLPVNLNLNPSNHQLSDYLGLRYICLARKKSIVLAWFCVQLTLFFLIYFSGFYTYVSYKVGSATGA